MYILNKDRSIQMLVREAVCCNKNYRTLISLSPDFRKILDIQRIKLK
jgi:hypothetical protein